MKRLVRHRRRVRRAKVASVTILVLLLGGGVAFGIDKGVAFGRRLWAEHHRPAPPTSTTTTLFTPSTTTVTGTLCTGAQVNAYLYNWRITSGTLYEVVALGNRSSTPCTLAGYPTLTALGTDSQALPSPNRSDASLGVAPGAPTAPVALASGQAGWFEFTYPVICSTVLAPGPQSSVVPGDCFEGVTLGVSVAQGSTTLLVNQPLRFDYGAAGFTVGPFQPGTPPSSPPVTQ